MDRSFNLKKIEEFVLFSTEVGDCPNIEFPTNGGGLLWKNVQCKGGWKLQYNYVTGLSRILDDKNIRKAWGSPNVMAVKFKRLTRSEFLEYGDVIGVVRKKAITIYEHYGVYIGNGHVIHYSGSDTDFNGRVCVRIDTLKNFLNDDDDYFVLYFDKVGTMPRKIQVKTEFNLNNVNYDNWKYLIARHDYRLYSPQETVKRALSRVGEDKYNLLLNNCEHFAVWCKTGVSESYQVKRVLGNLMSCKGK